MQTLRSFLQETTLSPTPLPGTPPWPKAAHHWSAPEMHALAAAAFSGRPLLVRGEPGCGKSQLARAAAAHLGWQFEYEVITPRFEPEHLMWRYDAVRRLADASDPDTKVRNQPEREYALPGALWRALDPVSAGVEPGQARLPGCVLLIDEIDKGDSDVPNSLLEVLGQGSFRTPFRGGPALVPADDQGRERPRLTIVTSNEERELPPAFVRRCMVLEIQVPDAQGAPSEFDAWLIRRGQAAFTDIDPAVLRRVAERVREDRTKAAGLGVRPGLAEYQDLLRALRAITADVQQQHDWLDRLGRYALLKQRGLQA